MLITKYYSPNFDKKKRSSNRITCIILHYTGMQSERESLKRLVSHKSKVSCHYLINRSGSIFNLVNELDLVLSYRISISEVLIYSGLPVEEENVDIDEITNNLSNIIAQSKVNIASLPDVKEFEKHKTLVKDAVSTAENLHGRYLGALRNNEYGVAASIATAIYLNKETELDAFKKSLNEFNENALFIYDNFSDLP